MKIALSARALTAAATIVLIAAPALLAPGLAIAAGNNKWGIEPAASPTQQAKRQFFAFQMDPGQTVEDAITLRNQQAVSQRLTLYAADASNVPGGGGFALTNAGEPVSDVGSWVKLSKTEVVLPPNGSETVSFAVTPPKDAKPGDHSGGIVSVEPAPSTPEVPVGPDGNASAITIRQAVGVRLFARISGPVTPGLTVDDLSVSPTTPSVQLLPPDSLLYSYTLTNTGNINMEPKVTFTATGLFGRELFRTETQAPVILPGQTVTLTQAWDSPPPFDRVVAQIDVVDDDYSVGSDTVNWVFGWVVLLVPLVVLLAVAGWLFWRRRRQGAIPEEEANAPVRRRAHAAP